MYYSRKTNGFYTLEIHGDNMPTDAVEISDETWKELLSGQSSGRKIDSDENGLPVLTDPVPTVLSEDDEAEAKIQAEIRAMAVERLKSKGELESDYIDKKGVL